MDKLTMAHEFYIANKDNYIGTSFSDIAKQCFGYVDAMQAEADKRKEKGVPDVLKVSNSTPLEWRPDWGQAPDQAHYYAQDALCATWFIDKPIFVQGLWGGKSLGQAPSFDYQGDWRNSLRKRPQ